MRDLALRLENRPGALAEMGEALGKAGVSVEGGGAFVVDGKGIAHFLVKDAGAARAALTAGGIEALADRDVLVVRIDQAKPGRRAFVCGHSSPLAARGGSRTWRAVVAARGRLWRSRATNFEGTRTSSTAW